MFLTVGLNGEAIRVKYENGYLLINEHFEHVLKIQIFFKTHWYL